MEDAFANAQKDGDGSNDLHLKEEREENHSGFSNLSSNRLTKRINPLHILHFNVMQCRPRNSCTKNSVFPIGFGLLEERIPKRLVTVDEKYIQQCLELIHLAAWKPARDNISVKLSLVKTSIPNDYLNLAKTRIGETCNVDRLIAASPLTSGSGSVVISPLGKWIVGSIMGSKSLMNIMKSPLFHHFGALENTSNSHKIDSKESPYGRSQFSSQSRETGGSNWENRKYESESANEELVSTSGTFCSSSPQSSLDSAPLYRGMLQCKWKDGIPYFVFSSDDHKESYEANLWKVNWADDKGSDYIYLFQTGKNGGKDNESYNEESRLAGKMTVSTAFSLCSNNNSKVMETEFVLYGCIDKSEVEINSSGDNLRKKKLLPRKVVEVFRPNHSSKQRSVGTFSGPISGRETPKNLEAVERFHLLDNNLPSNFQLAAIVVKDHLRDNHPDHSVGGWGLKFLKKVETKPTSHLLEKSMPSESLARSRGECSTSTDILIPAGVHGGPRTRIGGPSSLIERWRSGGLCDCGGWDLGCPLTRLKVWKSQEELLPEADMHGECKSVDIHVQGSDLVSPALRMVNIRDDLYFIHFQPNLSSLQSFSIAVAIIHSRSPTLKPKSWLR